MKVGDLIHVAETKTGRVRISCAGWVVGIIWPQSGYEWLTDRKGCLTGQGKNAFVHKTEKSAQKRLAALKAIWNDEKFAPFYRVYERHVCTPNERKRA